MHETDASEGRSRAVPAAVRIERGALATEQALLGQVEAFAAAARRDPTLLARPLRIVVPSRSLREHLASSIVRRLGGAAAGISIHTLRALAFELLRQAGEPAPGGDLLFPVLVRRLAREEAALREALDDLHDGYGVVAASVGDLLDAGLEPAQAEALDEWLAVNAQGNLGRRARSIVRVAARVSAVLEAASLEHRSGLFRRARERLADDPELLPCGGLLIHGYADATGVQAELLATLVRTLGGCAWIDHPPDPAQPEETAPGSGFTARLVGRFEGVGRLEPPTGAPPSSALALFRAPGAQAEAREVAERAARLIDEGVRPESIAVVMRDPAEYATPLRVHFRRLGVPLSALAGAPGPLGPEGRPVRGLLDLIRLGSGATADRWLDAAAWLAPLAERDLRLALHALGLGRLRDVAALDVAGTLGARAVYPLPVRTRIEAVEDDAGHDVTHPDLGASPAERETRSGRLRGVRRTLDRSILEDAVARASRTLRRLQEWPPRSELSTHLEQLAALQESELGWSNDGLGAREFSRRLERVREELGEALLLDFSELNLILERVTHDLGRLPLAGAGGGVQLLSVVEARARTFDHLFVLGLNRDRFPRPVTEDPLLPDVLRQGIETLLPDIPVKRRGFEEERYLFAQLCSAAPAVTLSWQEVSDDGKERPASPLVERIRLSQPGLDAPLVPGVYDPERSGSRPAHEWVVLAGISESMGDDASRGRHRECFELALEELARAWPDIGRSANAPLPSRLASARCAVLAELDPRGHRPVLGPFFGFVGAGSVDEEPYVTWLEGMARCPWQTFLRRVLRLEAMPDALVTVPAIDALSVGNVLHRVLERIVVEAGGARHEEIDSSRPPVDVAWPGEDELARLLREEALAVARQAGFVLPGFARALEARVAPLLENVKGLDWPGGLRAGVLGAELRGSVQVEDEDGRQRRIHFRADRVDLIDAAPADSIGHEVDSTGHDLEGASGDDSTVPRLRLVDYKAGRPVYGSVVKGDTRTAHLHGAIARGEWLQAASYARFAQGAVGEYLFARPESAERLAADLDDTNTEAAFDNAVATLLRLADTGCFYPRLIEDDVSVPQRCRDWCEVAPACLQRDAGARYRIADWVQRPRASSGSQELAPAERALFLAWALGKESR